MQSLKSRILALEKRKSPNQFTVIIRRFVAPGHVGDEIDHIEDRNGKSWSRQPGETEDDFIDRAKSECSPNPKGIPMLTGKTLHAQP